MREVDSILSTQVTTTTTISIIIIIIITGWCTGFGSHS